MAKVEIRTELAGRVCSVLAEVGQVVDVGDEIIVLEAMKMEIPVASSSKGKVISIPVALEDSLEENDVVAVLEAE
jgi:acetyl-CoA carboxylase biotin carboxyl carrier protein